MSDRPRASWHAGTNAPTASEALERIATHRLIVGLRGYAAILRDVAEIMEPSDERSDVLFVADRLARSVPVFEKRVGQLPGIKPAGAAKRKREPRTA